MTLSNHRSSIGPLYHRPDAPAPPAAVDPPLRLKSSVSGTATTRRGRRRRALAAAPPPRSGSVRQGTQRRVFCVVVEHGEPELAGAVPVVHQLHEAPLLGPVHQREPILSMCEDAGWHALDCSEGDFLRRRPDQAKGLQGWRAFLGKVLNQNK